MDQFVIPKSYKAAQLIEQGKDFQIVELEIPQLKEGEVLIKVEAAPVNHFDLFLKSANHHGNTLPAILGFEGSGVIVRTHESVLTSKIGSRVAFLTKSPYGSYGQYAVATSNFVIHLDDDITFEAGANSIGNPVTVLSMWAETKEQEAKTVVNTAAASGLGRMLVRYFQESGINVINIVRREEQVQLLKQEGAKYVLNSSSPSFLEDLKQLATELEATVFFDAIGGPQTGLILQQLPNNSTAYVYGMLSGQDVNNVTAADLLFKSKTIKGFTLFSSLHKYNPFTNPEAQRKLNDSLKSTLRTEYTTVYPLEKINEAYKLYEDKQTEKKFLIKLSN